MTTTTFRIIWVAVLAVVLFYLHQKTPLMNRPPQPHELLAGAIVLGALFISWSMDTAAEAIKEVARAWQNFADAIREKQGGK